MILVGFVEVNTRPSKMFSVLLSPNAVLYVTSPFQSRTIKS